MSRTAQQLATARNAGAPSRLTCCEALRIHPSAKPVIEARRVRRRFAHGLTRVVLASEACRPIDSAETGSDDPSVGIAPKPFDAVGLCTPAAAVVCSHVERDTDEQRRAHDGSLRRRALPEARFHPILSTNFQLGTLDSARGGHDIPANALTANEGAPHAAKTARPGPLG